MAWGKTNLKAIENFQAIRIPNLIQYLGGWSLIPVGIIITITEHCNLQCMMCPQVRDRQQQKSLPELTLNELRNVVDDLAASFRPKPFIHLIGGEPLLYHQLLSLVAYIKERGFRCSLTTNGLRLERYATELVRLGTNRVHVSIDGPPHVHDQVRGVSGVYDHAIAGIKALVTARQSLQTNQPMITINTVITMANLLNLEEMIPIAKSVGVDSLSYQHLIFSDCSARGQMVPDVDQFLAKARQLRYQARTIGLPITFYPRMDEKKLRIYYQGSEDQLNRKCVFPWYVVRIDTLGNITPCRGCTIDNVKTKTDSFRQVWNNQRFRSFRNQLARIGVFPDCGRCCHRQY